MALWKASILHLDFWGSNNEAVGKDSNMYEFMIGQGVPEDQATDFVSGMPTYWEINLLCCSCIHWNCSFLSWRL
jgi:hypothetical protein